MAGTWTYDVATNVIRITGATSGAPAAFIDAWNADKAGTLSLHARTGIAGTDASPIALTRNARPTDRIVLGGAKQDLYIVVTAWTNMTSATVRLIGTDSAGNAQTEDLAITGNGTYYATKYFATLTQSQVTAFSGTGSFAYEAKQAQWGVVWKLGTVQFQLDCILSIGDDVTASYFADNTKLVVFTVSTTWQMRVYANASCILGVLADAATKSTKQGCATVSTASSGFFKAIGGTAVFYSHTHIGSGISHWALQSNAGAYITAVYNCRFENVKAVTSYGTAFDLFNVYVTGSQSSLADGTITPSVDGLTVKASNYAVTLQGSNSLTVTGLIAGNLITSFILAYATSVDHYLIDAVWLDSNDWTITWGGGASTGKIYRKYRVNLKVTDKDNVAISGATVTLKDAAGNTVFSVATAADGTIAQQVVSKGYYDQAHLNALQDYGPHALTIAKAGYQTYVKTFVLIATVSWELKLAKAQSLLLDQGEPVLNMNPANPENRLILSL